MKTVLFMLALVFAAQAFTTESFSQVMMELNSDSQMTTPFGQDLLMMMEMKKGSAVDQIVKLLDELKANVQEKQKKADEQHTEFNNKWNAEIKELEGQIAQLTEEINQLTQEIGKLTADLVAAVAKLKNLKKQLALLISKKAALVKAREEDETHFKKRQEQQSKVQAALVEIIKLLSARLAQGKQGFIQKEEILDVLQKIGSNNPFAALVEFTMSFSPADVKHVINKLNDLLKAITASLAEDARLEVIAVKNYKNLIAEMNNVHQALDKEIAETKDHISELKDTLASKKKTKAQKIQLRKKAAASLKSTHEAQDAYNHQYALDTKERASEVATIDRVIVIVKNKAGAINRSAKLPTKF